MQGPAPGTWWSWSGVRPGGGTCCSEAQADLLRLLLQHRVHLVGLGDVVRLPRVHGEVGVADDHLFLPVLHLLQFLLLELFHHVVARDKNCLEEIAISEGRRAPEVRKEIDLARFFCHERCAALYSCHLLLKLLYIWNLQVIKDTLRWLLGMLSIVRVLNQIVESLLGLPPCLAFFLLLHFEFVFIYKRECEWKKVLWIRVEVFIIRCNLFPHLLFLELPYVQLLISIHEHLNALRDIHSLLGRATNAQTLKQFLILNKDIFRTLVGSLAQCLLESLIILVGVSLHLGLIMLLGALKVCSRVQNRHSFVCTGNSAGLDLWKTNCTMSLSGCAKCVGLLWEHCSFRLLARNHEWSHVALVVRCNITTLRGLSALLFGRRTIQILKAQGISIFTFEVQKSLYHRE